MRERPIIFSTEMVKAILEARKGMTRRVIKPQPTGFIEGQDSVWKDSLLLPLVCPYGQVGDRLWVREGFYSEAGDIWYKADGQTAPMPIKWKPSIFMPRWASRILLEITEVRAERLQEITEEDVIAEGIPRYTFARGCASTNPPDPRWKFIELWDSLNAKRGYSWGSNPWVWVISFRQYRGR